MPLLCFDLDNTLISSTKAHVKAFQKAFAKNNLPKKKEKDIIKYFSLESSQVVKKLYPKISEEQKKKIVKDHDYFVIHKTIKEIKEIPGATKTLKILKKDYELAILSNSKHKEIVRFLKAAGLKKSFFNIIIGNDDVKHPKPAPDEIIKAEQLLKLNDGYIIGDSIYDIRAGKKAKVKTIAVLTGDHTKKQLQKEKPWKILPSIKDLPKLLRNT